VTSGLGGIYPPDLPIGKVISIHSDSAGNLDYGVVEPEVDFSALYEVLVITGIKEGYTAPVVNIELPETIPETTPDPTENPESGENIEGEQTEE